MKFNQLGRSMVEMLGVLAIIGVLSVGAISGYSKAMMKYKLNKQAEQANTIINACIRYLNDLRIKTGAASGQNNLIPYLNKLGEIPEDMLTSNLSRISDVFKTEMSIYYHETNYLGIIYYIDASHSSMEQCINIITTAKENHSAISTIFFRNDYDDKDNEWSTRIYGDVGCTKNVVCLKDMQISDIYDRCSFCESSQCLLYITFR